MISIILKEVYNKAVVTVPQSRWEDAIVTSSSQAAELLQQATEIPFLSRSTWGSIYTLTGSMLGTSCMLLTSTVLPASCSMSGSMFDKEVQALRNSPDARKAENIYNDLKTLQKQAAGLRLIDCLKTAMCRDSLHWEKIRTGSCSNPSYATLNSFTDIHKDITAPNSKLCANKSAVIYSHFALPTPVVCLLRSEFWWVLSPGEIPVAASSATQQ